MADESAPAVPLFKKRGPKATFRKRAVTPPPNSDSEDFTSSEDESGRKIKRRRPNPVQKLSTTTKSTTTDLTTSQFAADASATIKQTNDATKQSNWYEEKAIDDLSAKSLLGKTRERQQDDAQAIDGTYKGKAGYQSYIQKNPNAPSKQVGPMKAPTNIRTITITDFAPDVCKDYKQTGFCGFGDNCKYLHAREDYKAGWALDRDWEISTKGKKQEGTIVASASRGGDNNEEGETEEEIKMLEKIPFACIICKEPYKSPIVTKCQHYFCEACALKKYRKNPNCAACGAGTGGVFNTAKNLQKILDKKRKREERLKAEAEAEAKDE